MILHINRIYTEQSYGAAFFMLCASRPTPSGIFEKEELP